MRTDSTPTEPLADAWRVSLPDALALRDVVTSEAELRRLTRTLERLQPAAIDAMRATATATATCAGGDAGPERFDRVLDALADD